MNTWCIWMLMPDATGGWSRVAAGLSKEDAERFAASMLFRARAMPDRGEDDEIGRLRVRETEKIAD